jgi:predicted HAD superfamily Cof-like phosphohydrolase
MTKEQNQVIGFMHNAGQTVRVRPDMAPIEERVLRARLILEEAFETISKGLGLAVEVKTRTNDKECDDYINLVDLESDDFTYSKYGEPSLIELADGLADLHYVAYCGTAITCGIDMEPVFKAVHDSNMSKFIDGHRRDGGKWIKGPSYFPVNIKPILEAQERGYAV